MPVRPWIAGIFALLCLSAPVRPAAAAPWSAFKGVPVSDVRVEGAPKDLAEAMKKGLELRGDPGLLRTARATFFPETLGEDLARCRLFLARHGYPDATVEPEIVAADRDRAVRVTFVVTTGPAVRLGELR
ncbi:MAG TPA: POTRA domain-containing protein, partial [bacterium]|nr:POTRA domain-containing protein [bacterium]